MNTPPPHPSHPQPPAKTPGMAIASFVIGILSLLGAAILIIPPTLAVIFGHLSRGDSGRKGIKAGRGIALAGLIMGYVSFVPAGIGILAAMAIPAFQEVREQAIEKTITNNLRQISAAADIYFLANENEEVTFEELMSGPKYSHEIHSVRGETYPETIGRDDATIEAVLPNGETIRIERR